MQSKPHLLLLDALRGVAALIVLYYHCFECFGYEIAESTGLYTQHCDHGYLAVDFFFLLSGFVIAYAYDDRWQSVKKKVARELSAEQRGMSLITFFKRRLIRLHPMVIAGAVIGLACYLLDGGTNWEGNPATAGNIALVFFMTLVMLPVFPGWGADVRGNGEMFPLNGPQWSLFFEYIGNIFYALLLRRLSTRALACVTAACGIVLGAHVLQIGYLGEGWSFVDNGFTWGLLRMLFPYALGMLLCRIFLKKRSESEPNSHNRGFMSTFIACSAALIVLLPVPFVGNPAHPWQNGLYILFLTMLVFPVIIWAAASAGTGKNKLCMFLGEISYPLYIVHYPLMYMFYRYHGFPNVTCTMGDVWPMAVATFFGSIVLATVFLYCYDKPLRRWLSKK